MKKSSRIVEVALACVVAVAHFLFWGGMHYGCLHQAYLNAYFDTSWALLRESTVEGELVNYLSNFLLCFFRWRWIGAALLFVPVVAVYLLVRSMLKRLQLQRLSLLAFIPALTMMYCQQYEAFFVQKSLVALFVVFCCWQHVVLSSRPARLLLLLEVAVAIPLLANVELALLLVLLMATELLTSSDRLRYLLAAAFGAGAVAALVCYWARPEGAVTYSSEALLLLSVLMGVLLLVLLCSLFASYVDRLRGARWVLPLVVVLQVAMVFLPNDTLRKKEMYARADMALLNNDMSALATLCNTHIKEHKELHPYLFYAYASMGQLPQRLFTYEVNDSNIMPEALTLYTGRQTVLSVCFNRSLGLLNEALHQAFQQGVSLENGERFGSLCMITDLNIALGRYAVAEKYLKQLERTLVHDDFVQSRRATMRTSEPQGQSVDFDGFLHIDKNQFLNVSYALFLLGNESRLVKDYFLCSLLLMGESDRFCQSYSELYPAQQCTQRVYAEALLMARDMGKYTMPCTVPEKVERDWMRFKVAMADFADSGNWHYFQPFRSTWWYYFVRKFMFNNE